MKKIIVTVALGAIIPLMSFGQASPNRGGTTGTSMTVAGLPHNFSDQSWNSYVDAGYGEQICQPCHTPHNGDLTTSDAPLWNHELSVATYTMFQSTKTGMNVTAPTGTSVLCLSCHDGTVAVGSYGGRTGITGTITGRANLDVDLDNDHPISIDYATVIGTSTSWRALDFNMTGVWDATAGTYTKTQKTSSLLKSGKIECTSCHRAHSNSIGYQLAMSNRLSKLCLTCHVK